MWRRRVFEILTNPRHDDGVGRAVSLGLLCLIAANVTASILETDAALAAEAPNFFYWFEIGSVAVFTIEYLVRLWACSAEPEFAGVRGRLRMMVTPLALVDLIAIAPFYVELVFPGTLDLRFLRVLRLMRVFRLLRIPRVAEAMTTVVRVVRMKRVELGITLAVVFVAMLLAAGAIYVVERNESGTAFSSIPRAMWWSVETITTIGYGDMIPTTALGKVIGGIVAFDGICAIALPVGLLSSGFIDELNRKKAALPTHVPLECPHCGHSLDDRAA